MSAPGPHPEPAAPGSEPEPAAPQPAAGSSLGPLLHTLEDPGAPPGELTDAHLTIVSRLSGEGGKAFTADFRKHFPRLCKVFKAHISSPNLELSNAALQALGFCTFNSNNTAELSVTDMQELLAAVSSVAVQCSDKNTRTRALWVISKQAFPAEVVSKEVSNILSTLETILTKGEAQSVVVEYEALNVIIRLMEQAPCAMAAQAVRWARLVLPLVAHCAHKVQLRGAAALEMGMPLLLQRQPEVAAVTEHLMSTKLISELQKLFSSKNETFVLKLWPLFVRLLGKTLHRSGSFINSLLQLEELGFRSGSPVVKKIAFIAWKSLIDNFALNPDILCSAKRLKLLMQPLSSIHVRTEALALTKLEVWWYLLVRLGPHLPSHFEQVCVPLIQSTLSVDPAAFPGTPSRPNSSSLGPATTPGQKPGAPRLSLSPAGVGVVHPFPSLQLLGMEMLLHFLRGPSVGEFAKDNKILLSLEPLQFPLVSSSSFFCKHSNTLIRAVQDGIIGTGKEIPDCLLTVIWKDVNGFVKSAIEAGNKKEKGGSETLPLLLQALRNIVSSNSLPVPRVLSLMAITVQELPPRVLGSPAYQVADMDLLNGTPALFLIQLPFHNSLLERCVTDERFFGILEALVGFALSGPTSALAFSESVLGVIDQSAGQVSNKEHLWRMWSIVVNPLTEWINQNNEVNQGDALEHNFSAVYSALLLPVSHIFPTQGFPQPCLRSLLRSWSELYRAFARCAALVATAEENLCCEELCAKIMAGLEGETPVVFSMLEGLTHLVSVMVDCINFAPYGTKFQPKNRSPQTPTDWAKKKKEPLGKLSSLLKLLLLLLNSFHELSCPEQQAEPLGQQGQPMGQQAQPLGQQAQPLGQQGQQAQPLGQQAQPMGQQGQQAQPLGQQAEPMGQQAEPMGQQAQPLGQQAEPLGQQAEPLGQQAQGQQAQPLGQQGEPLEQRAEPLGLALLAALQAILSHISLPSLLGTALGTFARPLALFYERARLPEGPKVYSSLNNKLEKLLAEVLQCLQRHCPGSWDSELLQQLSPVLCAAFLHRSRHIRQQGAQLWNCSFARAASLTYPPELRSVLSQVKKKIPLLLPGFESIEVSEECSGPFSDLMESSQLDAKISGMEVKLGHKRDSILAHTSEARGDGRDNSSNTQATPAKLKLEFPSTKTTNEPLLEEEKSVDFVFIPPETKPRILTEHQKEVLRTKRADIPAMYNTLDASQDTSCFSQYSQSQEDSLEVPPAVGNAKEDSANQAQESVGSGGCHSEESPACSSEEETKNETAEMIPGETSTGEALETSSVEAAPLEASAGKEDTSDVTKSSEGKEDTSDVTKSSEGIEDTSDVAGTLAGKEDTSNVTNSSAGKEDTSDVAGTSVEKEEDTSDAINSSAGKEDTSDVPSSSSGKESPSDVPSSSSGKESPSDVPSSSSGKESPSDATSSSGSSDVVSGTPQPVSRRQSFITLEKFGAAQGRPFSPAPLSSASELPGTPPQESSSSASRAAGRAQRCGQEDRSPARAARRVTRRQSRMELQGNKPDLQGRPEEPLAPDSLESSSAELGPAVQDVEHVLLSHSQALLSTEADIQRAQDAIAEMERGRARDTDCKENTPPEGSSCPEQGPGEDSQGPPLSPQHRQLRRSSRRRGEPAEGSQDREDGLPKRDRRKEEEKAGHKKLSQGKGDGSQKQKGTPGKSTGSTSESSQPEGGAEEWSSKDCPAVRGPEEEGGRAGRRAQDAPRAQGEGQGSLSTAGHRVERPRYHTRRSSQGLLSSIENSEPGSSEGKEESSRKKKPVRVRSRSNSLEGKLKEGQAGSQSPEGPAQGGETESALEATKGEPEVGTGAAVPAEPGGLEKQETAAGAVDAGALQDTSMEPGRADASMEPLGSPCVPEQDGRAAEQRPGSTGHCAAAAEDPGSSGHCAAAAEDPGSTGHCAPAAEQRPGSTGHCAAAAEDPGAEPSSGQSPHCHSKRSKRVKKIKSCDCCFKKPRQQVTESKREKAPELEEPERSPAQSPAQSPVQSPAQTPDHSPAQSPAQSPTQSPDQSPAQSPDHSPAQNNDFGPSDLEESLALAPCGMSTPLHPPEQPSTFSLDRQGMDVENLQGSSEGLQEENPEGAAPETTQAMEEIQEPAEQKKQTEQALPESVPQEPRESCLHSGDQGGEPAAAEKEEIKENGQLEEVLSAHSKPEEEEVKELEGNEEDKGEAESSAGEACAVADEEMKEELVEAEIKVPENVSLAEQSVDSPLKVAGGAPGQVAESPTSLQARCTWSPSASPSTSILKRGAKRSQEDDALSPANKIRRVSFANPIFQEGLADDIDRRSPVIRSHCSPSSRSLKILSNMQITEMAKESLPSLSELVYPALAGCKAPVDVILPQITSNICARGLGQLIRAKNIKTVGDLSTLTALEIKTLPIRSPKVSNVKRALKGYHEQQVKSRVLEESTVPEDAEKPGNDVEEKSQGGDEEKLAADLVDAGSSSSSSEQPPVDLLGQVQALAAQLSSEDLQGYSGPQLLQLQEGLLALAASIGRSLRGRWPCPEPPGPE